MILWISATAFGFVTLGAYETAAGDPGAPSAAWPAESALAAPDGRPALVVLAHPQCPCTRATISELERLLARVDGRAATYVLFIRPESFSEEWMQSDLWRRASRLPGVHVVADPGGHEARRFGAATSGHAFVYDASGQLRFSGGLTASRGHEGDNAGRSAVEDLLLAGDSPRDTTPVYGCPLDEHAL